MGAEEVATVIVGFATALTVLLGGRRAKQQIQKKPEASAGMVEVAGALINGEDARALASEFRANIDEKILLRGEVVRLRKALEENSEVCRAIIHAAEDVERALQAMMVELIRNTRK